MTISKTIIGKAPALKSLLRSVQLIAPTHVNVLITGETGTGKELIADAIQKNSLRSNNVFFTLNCAAQPESTILRIRKIIELKKLLNYSVYQETHSATVSRNTGWHRFKRLFPYLALEGLMFTSLEQVVILVAAVWATEALRPNVRLPLRPRIALQCQIAHGMQARNKPCWKRIRFMSMTVSLWLICLGQYEPYN